MRGLTLALPEAIKLIAAGKLKKKIRIKITFILLSLILIQERP